MTKISFWKRGPREWSPRLKRGLRMVRQLHDLFPKYMLHHRWPFWNVGDIHSVKTLRGDELFMLVFTVTFEREGPYGAVLQTEGVWITPEGVIDVGGWIWKLLGEGLPGYESLAGRWPWPD